MTERSPRNLLWALWSATLVLYLVIVLWSLPVVMRDAGDMLPFDMMPWGYDHATAEAFMAALGDTGRAQYLGPQRWLDIVFPVCLAASLVLSFPRLFSRRLALLLVVVAVVGLLADLGENQAVRWILLADSADLDPGQVTLAATFTRVKSACATIALSAVLFGAGRVLWRRWRATP